MMSFKSKLISQNLPKMKAIALIVALGLIACVSAGILSPYVGYSGYYSAPVVSRSYVSSPYVSSYVSPYVSPYVSSYVATAPVVRSYVSPVSYTSAYASPYDTYSYLLKK
ncbi:uncharacterized protein LOC128962420 [Oppia nitens]|uniref:uncharacterized protein LOC128962420 n=1 Tax=Oppia nitens TaxID=1686743 RepID=UPI0023DB3724|nr:uncharacterized protein LOC128962420 [Oppia nitens]